MKLLLDTHTLLWLDTAPEKLSPAALSACENPENEILLSVVSAWEIQIKHQLGRLVLDIPAEQMIDGQRSQNGLSILSVELRHVYALNDLPAIHHDPFDRLLIAQSIAENATMVSADGHFKKYGASVIW